MAVDFNSVIITGTVRRESPVSTTLTRLEVECITLTNPKARKTQKYIFCVEAPTRLTISLQPGDRVRIVGLLENMGDSERIVIAAEHVEVRQ